MNYRFALTVVLFLAVTISLTLTTSRTQSQNKPTDFSLNDSERDLLSEINEARAHPQVYASYLEKLKPLFKGKEYTATGHAPLTTQEGWSAVEDAINFLKATKPLPPLVASRGLSQAALTHVKDQNNTGASGHKGTGQTMIEERVKPFGIWEGAIGENISYGNDSARERLLTWLIDDGVSTRGHRRRLMSSDYQVAGISCGTHPEWKAMCVLTLAGRFIDSNSTTPATPAVKSAPTSSPTESGNTNTKPTSTSKSQTSKAKSRKL